jgi:CHAT domain-containing protein
MRYPLEALVTEAGAKDNNGDYRQVPFLVRRVALSYVPAPRILVNIRKGHTAGEGLRPFIGFGDFRPASVSQLAASFPSDRCGEDSRLLQGLRPLPETRTQVTTIGKQLGAGAGDMLLGEAFTKQRLAAPDLGQYRIVLLATHAFLPGNTLRCITEPAITVSAPPRAGNAADEFERVGDIEKLKLNADLVALSACDTSGASGGESLSGLARAFFLAGAHGLMVSHWDVVTGASVPLMIGTFGAGTADSAQALRTAQLRMIDSAGSGAQAPIEISHPNYWAAFVLIGDGVRRAPGA